MRRRACNEQNHKPPRCLPATDDRTALKGERDGGKDFYSGDRIVDRYTCQDL